MAGSSETKAMDDLKAIAMDFAKLTRTFFSAISGKVLPSSQSDKLEIYLTFSS